jgi:hypothetical protein
MIVFKKATDETGTHSYSHIECDAPGCFNVSPSAEKLIQMSLYARGWFVAGGQHRCPEHFDDETPPQGPVDRAADGSEGFIR